MNSNNKLKIKNEKLKMRRGQSLVETLVALAVVVLVVTGIVALGIQTVRGAVNARNRAFAYQKAQEEGELVRALKDQAYSGLQTCPTVSSLSCSTVDPPNDCHVLWSGSSWLLVAGGRENIDGMQRWFRRSDIQPGPGQDRNQVLVCVQWSDPSGIHTVTVQTVLTNWR